MFEQLNPLQSIPADVFNMYPGLELYPAEPTQHGQFHLTDVRPTFGAGFEGQRLKVLVVDENGFPIPNIKVAWSFSTADVLFVDGSFQWFPPFPRRAVVTHTSGGGETDLVLGAEGIIKQGEQGGVSVFVFEPNYSSVVIRGAGMTKEHGGLHFTFQLRRRGVMPLGERLAVIEARLRAVEQRNKS